MKRQNISSGRPWEASAGMSRAVRVGPFVDVSLTTPTTPEGEILHPGDVYAQTRAALELIGRALAEAGASFEHVYRSRIYLRDMSQWPEAGRAHGEVFGEIRPTLGWIGVSDFFHPDIVAEVEVSALLEEPPA